ncbi:MAG: hypothetical protein FJX46_09230 [Alphaproteobacteria bacterium]|nr:hypothetical protein [Alphaproteobacteria bacterium]
MRFLVDQCVSPQVGEVLRRFGHDAVHLRDRGMSRSTDRQVFEFAAIEGRVVVTFDLDFGELAMQSEMSGGRVIVMRFEDQRAVSVVARLLEIMPLIGSLGASWVVTLESNRSRVMPLPIGESEDPAS